MPILSSKDPSKVYGKHNSESHWNQQLPEVHDFIGINLLIFHRSYLKNMKKSSRNTDLPTFYVVKSCIEIYFSSECVRLNFE